MNCPKCLEKKLIQKVIKVSPCVNICENAECIFVTENLESLTTVTDSSESRIVDTQDEDELSEYESYFRDTIFDDKYERTNHNCPECLKYKIIKKMVCITSNCFLCENKFCDYMTNELQENGEISDKSECIKIEYSKSNAINCPYCSKKKLINKVIQCDRNMFMCVNVSCSFITRDIQSYLQTEQSDELNETRVENSAISNEDFDMSKYEPSLFTCPLCQEKNINKRVFRIKPNLYTCENKWCPFVSRQMESNNANVNKSENQEIPNVSEPVSNEEKETDKENVNSHDNDETKRDDSDDDLIITDFYYDTSLIKANPNSNNNNIKVMATSNKESSSTSKPNRRIIQKNTKIENKSLKGSNATGKSQTTKKNKAPQPQQSTNSLFNVLELLPLSVECKIISALFLHLNVFEMKNSSKLIEFIKLEFAICNKLVSNMKRIDLIRPISLDLVSKLNELSRLIGHQLPRTITTIDSAVIHLLHEYFIKNETKFDTINDLKCKFRVFYNCQKCNNENVVVKNRYYLTIPKEKWKFQITTDRILYKTICRICNSKCALQIKFADIPRFLILYFPTGLKEQTYRYGKPLKSANGKLSLISAIESDNSTQPRSNLKAAQCDLTSGQFLSLQSESPETNRSVYQVHFQNSNGWYSFSEDGSVCSLPVKSAPIKNTDNIKILIYGKIPDNNKYDELLNEYFMKMTKKIDANCVLFNENKSPISHENRPVKDRNNSLISEQTICESSLPNTLPTAQSTCPEPRSSIYSESGISVISLPVLIVEVDKLDLNRFSFDKEKEVYLCSPQHSIASPRHSRIVEPSLSFHEEYDIDIGTHNDMNPTSDTSSLFGERSSNDSSSEASTHSRSTASYCRKGSDDQSVSELYQPPSNQSSEDHLYPSSRSGNGSRKSSNQSDKNRYRSKNSQSLTTKSGRPGSSSGVSSTSSIIEVMRTSNVSQGKKTSFHSQSTASEARSDGSNDSKNTFEFLSRKRGYTIDDLIVLKRKKISL